MLSLTTLQGNQQNEFELFVEPRRECTIFECLKVFSEFLIISFERKWWKLTLFFFKMLCN